MGIPVAWLPVLARAGFPKAGVIGSPGWNICAGTWVLAVMRGRDAGRDQTAARPAMETSAGPLAVSRLARLINTAASTYHLPAAFITAVMLQESGGNPTAGSPKGAMGLMQLIPATAARYGVSNPWSPRQSLMGGAAYLAHLVREFNGNPTLVLAGYNAGGQAVRNAGYRIPPYAQTQQYVPAVLVKYQQLTDQ
ncbi:lytic transglycosylase domain-containing protein [Acidithiobacillus sp. MC6.1]|nr:lytic transglycosylase domain-containing protein [Acidithiobacillus sp. MC6.1]